MTIVFFRSDKIGDSVVAIKAIYAIKALHPKCHLIVFTNAWGRGLYKNLGFIDELLDVERDFEALKQREIDFFVISNKTSRNIALAKSTKARKIIVRLHFHSALRQRFINEYNFSTHSRKESENLLFLVRLIDKKIYDSGIGSVDFTRAKLQTSPKNEAFVQDFLDKSCVATIDDSCVGGGAAVRANPPRQNHLQKISQQSPSLA